MVSDSVRAFMRRHPNVRYAARQLRIRLPEGWGGLDRQRVPPRVRRFDLAVPRRGDTPASWPDRVHIAAPGDYWLPRQLHHHGIAGHEPEGQACFLAALDVCPPGSVLDVGANIGLYTLLAATRSERTVYAFEPAPEIAAVARGIAGDNALSPVIVEVALSNHTGTGALVLSTEIEGSAVLVDGTVHDLGRITVPVDTLARWRDRAGTAPAVVKIDTEATEPEVVAGALEILRRHRPWVVCEVRGDRSVAERLTALMEPLEYSWHHLAGAAPQPARPAITADDDHRMWLLAPQQPPAGFWSRYAEWHRALLACPG